MAGFNIVNEPIRTVWLPVHYNAETLYQGQFVTLDSTTPDYGLKAWNVAGANDTTADQVPLGIVIGFNNKTPVFNTTYKAEYGLSVSTVAAQLARDWTGAEGMWSKSEPALLAQIALIDPTTYIKGRIFNGTYGTACTVVTNTTADATGATITTATMDEVDVAGGSIWYCRSGSNMGLYRVSYSASATAHTFYLTWPNGLAANDTFVRVDLALGTCKGMFDSVGTYIEQYGDDAQYATNYIYMTVISMNLKDAGNEYAIFRLTPNNFFPVSRT